MTDFNFLDRFRSGTVPVRGSDFIIVITVNYIVKKIERIIHCYREEEPNPGGGPKKEDKDLMESGAKVKLGTSEVKLSEDLEYVFLTFYSVCCIIPFIIIVSTFLHQ